MQLSVVIPTRNRAAALRSALESLTSQSLPPQEFEILVVDNGSTDDTRATVEGFGPRLANLRYFFSATPGLHVGRHVGLREARTDILVYADDDIEATPGWLQAIASTFADSSAVLVGGNNYPRFEGSPPDWLARAWNRHSRELEGKAISMLSICDMRPGRRPLSPLAVWGCNFSIRKHTLLAAGGFHPDSMPDELIRFRGDGETHVSEYVRRSGLTCMFDSRASVYHSVPAGRMTFEYFQKRAFNQGVSDSYRALRGAGAGRVPSPSSVRTLARNARRRLRAFASDVFADADSRALSRTIREGYRNGYEFHQRQYAIDADVRHWVHKPDYF